MTPTPVAISGIHHITAIASDAVENLQFYTSVLGLRLVKKTVNQDDVSTYHLFFGDKAGHPGMDLTFFIFSPARQGKNGAGLVTMISLAVPEKSLEFWQQRFAQYKVKYEAITERFGLKRIKFCDADDQQLELVGVPDLAKDEDVWTTPEITAEQAIHSFYSATLTVNELESVEPILTQVFGYIPEASATDEAGYAQLYRVPNSDRAAYLEVQEQSQAAPGLNAAGTVHHIAFRAQDEEHQQMMRQRVLALGLHPTEEIDRFYFKSVYFRIPAGILFEIATDGPGFTADEPLAELGKKLALPPFLEPYRSQIEIGLKPLPKQ